MGETCDRCSIARAVVTIHCPKTDGRLAFCGHCWHAVEQDARAAKFVILRDERATLVAR